MYRGKLLEYFLKVFLLQLACFMSSWVNCQEVDTDYNEVIIETAVRRPTTPQLPAVRPSPWIAIPESAFPFPLIPQTAPMRAMAVLNGKTGLSTGQLLFNQNSANEVLLLTSYKMEEKAALSLIYMTFKYLRVYGTLKDVKWQV